MAMAIFRGKRAFALSVVGAATLFATMVGEFMMHNPARAQDFLHCAEIRCLDNHSGAFGQVPYPSTAVMLPT
ncbi:MAG TPA: hypothetical protein VLJ14_01460, partial [Ktedonobacterales bacterium]|nr:hypothetical protein [Ktedonobacterales bacterium]